jgi:hypothetical protein
MTPWRYATAILGVTLLAYHLADHIFLVFPGPDANMASFSETIVRVRQAAGTAPRVLCLGSSRIRHGLVPTQLEEHLGLAAGDVRNYGMDVGTPWMAHKLLAVEPQLGAQLDAVFLDVEPWQFNENYVPNRPERQIFYRLATPGEKLATGDLAQRALFLVDLVVPFMAENRPLEEWVRGLGYLTSPDAASQLELPSAWRTGHPPPDERFEPREAARRHMEDYVASPRLRAALAGLVGSLAERGVTVVLFQPPAVDDYVDALRAHPGYAEHLAWLRGFHDPARRVWVRVWERPAEVGLGSDAYIDYGHFSPEGAEAFTASFAADLPTPVLAAVHRRAPTAGHHPAARPVGWWPVPESAPRAASEDG